MKKLMLFFVLCYGKLCAMGTGTQERLNGLFDRLQKPVERNFHGTADDYREMLLQEVENSLNTEYELPINDQTKCHGETFLCRAAQYNLPVLSQRLASSAEKFNLAKAFWIASSRGHVKTVEKLLAVDPHITWQDSSHLGTGLHNASYRGHKEVVRRIIEYCLIKDKKSALQARDSEGKTPLDYAQENNNTDIMTLLVNGINGLAS